MSERKQERIGPVRMCGLIIGPILGSGIVILPPLAQQLAGDWAVPAWLVTVAVSMLFAWIFGRLSLLYPGEAGVTAAVEAAFGSRMKRLTAFYLIGAVLFGPVAVMLTVARHLPFIHDGAVVLPGVVMTLLAASLLLGGITFVGTVSLIASSLTAVTLLAGATATIAMNGWHWHVPVSFAAGEFAYTLLLLFWSVVGWEVIGNYSGDLRDPGRNLPRAVLASALVIALVTVVVAVAMQVVADSLPTGSAIAVSAMVTVIFGTFSSWVMGVLVLALCGCTFLLFVGGSARLMASLADQGQLPAALSRRTKSGAPLAAVGLLTAVHLCLFGAVARGLIDVEGLVAVADTFFLGNALIGILSAIRLFDDTRLRLAASLLALLLAGVLLQSSPAALAAAALLAGWIVVDIS